ncbi:hypothetical protein ABTX34_12850 [Streptomyces sp. NPDC096538]|uniref:hypothetical protein n=1 Tax=Streptomyces sp. NPDC096538 TaxID=3155427 RepID=UPI003333C435
MRAGGRGYDETPLDAGMAGVRVRGLPARRLHGGVPVAGREELVCRFQKRDFPVFLLPVVSPERRNGTRTPERRACAEPPAEAAGRGSGDRRRGQVA